MPKNDKSFLHLHDYLRELNYSNKWKESSDNKFVNAILNHASKKKNGNVGLPDFIYTNEKEKILIMIELKTYLADHVKQAIPEIRHYLSCFLKGYLSNFGLTSLESKRVNTAIENLKDWNILGLAISGDIEKEFAHKIDTFAIQLDAIKDMNITEIHDEEDYLGLFKNFNVEEISSRITSASSRINNLLYDVKEDKRPTLLSILLISLYSSKESQVKNTFRDVYNKYEPEQLLDQIGITVPNILGKKGENLPEDKIEMIMREFETFKNEKVLLETKTIANILDLLKEDVIPLFETKHNYDIIGKFYQEFLRYAGMVDVQSGIVLTPEHVTELFAELVDLKKNDVIFDSCCGTGSFLIAGMKKLIELNNHSQKAIKNVKTKQLIGNELRSHMYILAVSNMLFRGDGKSNILNYDFFSPDFDKHFHERLRDLEVKPTIGFINPPYSGSFTDYDDLQKFKGDKSSKSKNKKPWMKEISFLKKMCNICSRYVVMIAPPQVFMGESDIRNDLLKDNSIKAVINMPKELFQPNASTGSTIIVIETNKAHDFTRPVSLYNLKDDGFELAKKKGRRDVYNKWGKIKQKLLRDIDAPQYVNPKNIDGIDHCFVELKNNDEWLIQAFSKVDFDKLTYKDFERTIKEYMVFNVRKENGLVGKKINDIDLLTLLSETYKKGDLDD